METSNFTGLCPPSIFGVRVDDVDELVQRVIDLETSQRLNPPVKPSVVARQTITVDLNRGESGEVYVWSKEEAILIRDAINDALDNRPGHILFSQRCGLPPR